MEAVYGIFEKPKSSSCYTAWHAKSVTGRTHFQYSSVKYITECRAEALRELFPDRDYIVVEIKPIKGE